MQQGINADIWYRPGFYLQSRENMLQLLQLMSLVIGFEGFINGKVYVGIYTPKKEYGYVITENEIYLDTVYEKRLDTE